MARFTGPSAGPNGLKPCPFCMSSGISSRRNASICHWGEPYHTESVPQNMSRRPARPYVLASGDTVRLVWKEFDGEATVVKFMTSSDDGHLLHAPRRARVPAPKV